MRQKVVPPSSLRLSITHSKHRFATYSSSFLWLSLFWYIFGTWSCYHPFLMFMQCLWWALATLYEETSLRYSPFRLEAFIQRTYVASSCAGILSCCFFNPCNVFNEKITLSDCRQIYSKIIKHLSLMISWFFLDWHDRLLCK
jgi:hypothetical protein